MAKKKKQEVPKYIQAKFKKPQFNPGDFVCMTWLGEFIRGELVETYKTHEHVRYKIKAAGFTYICGIQIGDYKSEHADYGILLEAETVRRGVKPETADRTIHAESRRTTNSISTQTTGVRSNSNSNDRSNTTSTPRKSNATKNAANRSTSNDTKKKSKSVKRKNTELEQAVQRQKDFLNGFVKK
jgi:hypothetical protein